MISIHKHQFIRFGSVFSSPSFSCIAISIIIYYYRHLIPFISEFWIAFRFACFFCGVAGGIEFDIEIEFFASYVSLSNCQKLMLAPTSSSPPRWAAGAVDYALNLDALFVSIHSSMRTSKYDMRLLSFSSCVVFVGSHAYISITML